MYGVGPVIHGPTNVLMGNPEKKIRWCGLPNTKALEDKADDPSILLIILMFYNTWSVDR